MYYIERGPLAEHHVPADAYYGIQTRRAGPDTDKLAAKEKTK
jgi:aspartate ammonia-lyase